MEVWSKFNHDSNMSQNNWTMYKLCKIPRVQKNGVVLYIQVVCQNERRINISLGPLEVSAIP